MWKHIRSHPWLTVLWVLTLIWAVFQFVVSNTLFDAVIRVGLSVLPIAVLPC